MLFRTADECVSTLVWALQGNKWIFWDTIDYNVTWSKFMTVFFFFFHHLIFFFFHAFSNKCQLIVCTPPVQSHYCVYLWRNCFLMLAQEDGTMLRFLFSVLQPHCNRNKCKYCFALRFSIIRGTWSVQNSSIAFIAHVSINWPILCHHTDHTVAHYRWCKAHVCNLA